jgi:hypothetical protein
MHVIAGPPFHPKQFLRLTTYTATTTRFSSKGTSEMTCPLCNIANLVTIAMTVNQRQLTLHSCSRCETRWWKADGDQVGLGDVLQAARKTA